MTIIASEIDRFNRLSATWWNSAGPMRPLHVINELRLGYLRQLIAERFDCAGPSKLEGLRILDVGCGAGLMCEPLARSGAQVTGIDAAAKNVAAARIHAASQRITRRMGQEGLIRMAPKRLSQYPRPVRRAHSQQSSVNQEIQHV